MGYSGSVNMTQKAKQFTDQVKNLTSALKNHADIVAIEKSWAGKSMSIPYQDLARRLNNSGAIVDINSAKEGLKSKMGSQAYQELVNNAEHEINSSNVANITGGDREALSGFLVVNEADPITALKIMTYYLSPTTSSRLSR